MAGRISILMWTKSYCRWNLTLTLTFSSKNTKKKKNIDKTLCMKIKLKWKIITRSHCNTVRHRGLVKVVIKKNTRNFLKEKMQSQLEYVFKHFTLFHFFLLRSWNKKKKLRKRKTATAKVFFYSDLFLGSRFMPTTIL